MATNEGTMRDKFEDRIHDAALQEEGLWTSIQWAPAIYTQRALRTLASLVSGREITSDAELLDGVAMAMVLTGVCVFIIIMSGVKVVYGRYAPGASPWWGIPINAKVAWVFQEIPCVIIAWSNMASGKPECLESTVNQILLGLFMMHYVNRSVIYPLQMRGGKPTPCIVMLMAWTFCVLNGFMQSRMLTHVRVYEEEWFVRPCFCCGVAMFFSGMWINLQSDAILRSLRKPGDVGYKIPRGGLFTYVSGANFLGEMIEWCGFALAASSFEASAFAIFTFCNLAPRAYHHHLWYRQTWEHYPRSRKALIPFVF